jgi:iron complex outermembrane receptor protein
VRDQPPNGAIDLDTPNTTGSRLGLSARETPASVNAVSREQIEARGLRDTQEAARSLPGVSNSAPPGSAGTVAYRGFGTSNITQLFNGITVQYDAIAARPVDGWIYDRVEAIGGPSSFLFGSGAVGGALNYVTKTAQRDVFSEAQVRVGSFNTRQLSVGLNQRLAADSNTPGARGHYVRLDLNRRLSDGWVEGNRSQSFQLASSLLSDLSPNLTHLLAVEFQHERVERPYWGTPLLRSAGNVVTGDGRILPGTEFKNYNSRDGRYEQTVRWVRSVLDWQISPQLALKNTFYKYDALRDYQNVEVYTFNAANTAVIRSGALLQRHDQHLVGNRVEATLKSRLAGLQSDWAFGLDYSINRQTRFPRSLFNSPAQVPGSPVNPFNFSTELFFNLPGMLGTFVPDRENRLTTLAFSVENRTKLRPDLALVTALRHDRMNLALTNLGAVTAANPASFSRDYSPTTGRLGLVWDLSRQWNLYAQYATAADPPSGILTTATFGQVITNSQLTTGRQWELGTKFSFWDGQGSGSVAYYDIVRRNLSTSDPANPNNSLLVGQQSSRGVELTLGARLSPRLSLQGNLALLEAKFDDFRETVGGVAVQRAGNVPTNVPRQVANLWASYTLTPGWTASAGVRHVGRVFGNNANTFSAPAYTLLDLGLRWDVSRQVSVVGRVRNATNKLYAANITSTPMFFLGEPRSADVTLRVNF